VDFDICVEDSGAILKLDPRTKLVMFLTSSVASLTCYSMENLLIYGIVLCVITILCGKKWLGVKSLLIFLFLIFFRYEIVTSGKGSAAIGGLLTSLITIFLFFFPVFMSLMLITQTTRINQFLAAFDAMHMPNIVVIPIAVMFRFIPTVAQEWDGIRKAMAFRGISLEPWAIIRSPLKTIEYILIPLLFSSISIMEELAAAALARGLDSGNNRTSYETVKFRAVDYLVTFMFIGLAAFFVVGRGSL